MNKTALWLLLALALAAPAARAQRIVGELESNADQEMLADEDTIDGNSHKPKKIVPVDVRAWTIDPVVGTPRPALVDTLRHLFQNADHNEGPTGHYNSLSNMGSPRLSRIYMERPLNDHFIFLTPFSQFFVRNEQFRFYNTKSPYMNLTYQWAGSRTSGDDHFQALFANNIGKRFNFGGSFHYIYGKGYYDSQSTSFMDGTFFASYTGDRYDLHLRYTHNFMKMGENGGITDDNYITQPESFSRSYASNDIPTHLGATWNRQEHDIILLSHRYNIGFTRVDSDSIHGRYERFVPVTSIFHSLQVNSLRKNFRTYEQPDDYYTHAYLPGDTANVRDKMLEITNYAGLSLREGFNKYAVAGINAFIGFRHQRYNMPDTVQGAAATRLARKQFSLNDIILGAQLIRAQGHYLNYRADARFIPAGDRAGDFALNGTAQLAIPLLGDTAQIQASAALNHLTPSAYYNTYHTKYAWWDNDFSRIIQSRISGQIQLPKTRTRLAIAVENIKNYTYIADQGTPVTADDGTTLYTHNAVALQAPGNIQILSLTLEQPLHFGPLHFDNEITYQTTSDKDVIPLPALTTYTNLYLDFRIAKVLHCELGADLTYFTRYYAPDYSPAVGTFMTQNPQNLIQIGNYPLISAYANFYLKRTRFYVQYYHANKSDGRYFWAPHYPMNPSCIRFGISWNFYD